MALSAGQIPKVANVINSGVAALTGTTIGTLGSNTNGITIYTAGASGGRVMSLTGTTDDTVTVNVFIYIYRGSTVLPIGLVNVPLSSGNTFAAKTNVDFLNGANIVGLPIDNSGRQYIPLLANDVLKATTLANLTAAKTCWVVASGNDYQA
jgi:hypothetical protein